MRVRASGVLGGVGAATVTMADCAAPHLAEVFLRGPVAVDSAIGTVADRTCAAGVASYTGQLLTGSARH